MKPKKRAWVLVSLVLDEITLHKFLYFMYNIMRIILHSTAKNQKKSMAPLLLWRIQQKDQLSGFFRFFLASS